MNVQILILIACNCQLQGRKLNRLEVWSGAHSMSARHTTLGSVFYVLILKGIGLTV